jgi:hypothetical protein
MPDIAVNEKRGTRGEGGGQTWKRRVALFLTAHTKEDIQHAPVHEAPEYRKWMP